jgi:hypothetical protein
LLQNRPSRSGLIVALLLFVILLSGCIVVRDSPAPGCVKTIGVGVIGGCFGKTVILDLMVEPEIECLSIAVNNCNGGVLEVQNRCGEVLVIEGLKMPTEEYLILDVAKDDGRYVPLVTNTNFSDYTPEVDEQVEMRGALGGQEIELSFVKTAALCE